MVPPAPQSSSSGCGVKTTTVLSRRSSSRTSSASPDVATTAASRRPSAIFLVTRPSSLALPLKCRKLPAGGVYRKQDRRERIVLVASAGVGHAAADCLPLDPDR